MKKIVTKKQIRAEIDQQIADYLQHGGVVEEVARGISGQTSLTGPLKPDASVFAGPKTERTYVPDIIAAVEQRRSNLNSSTKKASKRKPKPKKKIIYDDFGEPLRWEWVEE